MRPTCITHAKVDEFVTRCNENKLTSTNQTLETVVVVFPSKHIYRQKLFRTLLTSAPFRLIANFRHAIGWGDYTSDSRGLQTPPRAYGESKRSTGYAVDGQCIAWCVCRGTTWLRKVVTKPNTKTEESACTRGITRVSLRV